MMQVCIYVSLGILETVRFMEINIYVGVVTPTGMYIWCMYICMLRCTYVGIGVYVVVNVCAHSDVSRYECVWYKAMFLLSGGDNSPGICCINGTYTHLWGQSMG